MLTNPPTNSPARRAPGGPWIVTGGRVTGQLLGIWMYEGWLRFLVDLWVAGPVDRSHRADVMWLGGPEAPADSGELGWSVTVRLGAGAATLVANDTELSPAPEGRLRLIPGPGTGSGDGLWSLSYWATPVTEADDHVEVQFEWPRLGMEPCVVTVPLR